VWRYDHRSGPAPGAGFFGSTERGVEITVGLLGRGDDGDEVVELLVERGIGMRQERVRRRLDDLVDVRVVVALSLVLAGDLVRGLEEVVDPARQLVLPHDVRDSDRAVDIEPRFPEAIGDPHVREGDGRDRVVRWLWGGLRRSARVTRISDVMRM